MFVCTVAKAEADVQHLWYGRRAATHIRSELMAAIYDKALKRKDFSGIVDKGEKKDDAPANGPKSAEDKKKEEKADDPKAGADVGKIVNLMAGDANKVCVDIVAVSYVVFLRRDLVDLDDGQRSVLHLWCPVRNCHWKHHALSVALALLSVPGDPAEPLFIDLWAGPPSPAS